MSGNKIQVTQSSMPEINEYIDEIKILWDSHWLTNMGVKHKELESQLLKYLEVPNIRQYRARHLSY